MKLPGAYPQFADFANREIPDVCLLAFLQGAFGTFIHKPASCAGRFYLTSPRQKITAEKRVMHDLIDISVVHERLDPFVV